MLRRVTYLETSLNSDNEVRFKRLRIINIHFPKSILGSSDHLCLTSILNCENI